MAAGAQTRVGLLPVSRRLDVRYRVRTPAYKRQPVRHGLSAEDALAAVTTTAAAAIGAPDGVGRLGRGDRADLVVFDGDPFEPTSRILAVVVGGKLVHRASDVLAAAGQ